jgi:rhamnose utilization protein RhaD (predicted bifunctional aldolase and dehydrogenase)
MSNQLKKTPKKLKEYCALIGKDPLLVQGAGGNASWKDEDVLWVKASGTWLAHAEKHEIFIPVSLSGLRGGVNKDAVSAYPKVIGDTAFRPSIETELHALMPHKVVLHLHAVEILAHLVRQDALQTIKTLIGDSVKWAFVDYFKPGAELAEAVRDVLRKVPEAEVVFLKSHGLIIGGNDINRIDVILLNLISRLKNSIISLSNGETNFSNLPPLQSDWYRLCGDPELNQLATDSQLSSRLQNAWVLYPDHAVFLGSKPTILAQIEELERFSLQDNKPTFIFVLGIGVYEAKTASPAQKAQLRCYYDVLVRQSVNHKLVVLTQSSIEALLNWEAEQYRKSFTEQA